jgi:spore coat polysaccharide biosynthesis protein SpsF
MRRVMIVQARMTSSRLPGKVLLPVAGQPMLANQLRRLKLCTKVDDIVVATTANVADDPVAELAHSEGVGCFRGSEDDVLARFVGAALEARADIVIRVTADCPLIDPGVSDRVIGDLTDLAHQCDYASNVIERTYPRGLDTEALFMDTLLRMDRLARSRAAREHVTVFLRLERPELFLCTSVMDHEDNSDLRWTVDTTEDLQFLRALAEAVDLTRRPMPYRHLIAYVREHPELVNPDSGHKTWDPTR